MKKKTLERKKPEKDNKNKRLKKGKKTCFFKSKKKNKDSDIKRHDSKKAKQGKKDSRKEKT